MANKLHLETALLADGWHRDVIITVERGIISSVGTGDVAGAQRVSGIVLPGLPNVHSHAFQRAMAGLTERRGSESDSFWTWREQMYRFVERLTPEGLEAIAALAYTEMLEAGFTSVAEFHYLHHQPDGRPYDHVAEMSQRIVAAANEVGIGLTLLPVLYRQGGFGGIPAAAAQRRFVCDRDLYARLMESKVPDGSVGIAPHSLRAVTLDDVKWAAATWPKAPAHIHISEQTIEVEQCLVAHGRRPIDLLMDTIEIDARWCLVHATHADGAEIARIAQSRAVVGLCPITEANLGDGLFDVPALLARGGRLGVGSDSNVRISAADELRTLEYGQRLVHRRRNVLGEPSRSTGRRLFEAALDGRAIAAGQRADLVVLDDAGFRGDGVVDHWLFSADNTAIKTVFCAGKPVVQSGRHVNRDAIAARYAKALAA
ncbi:MAG: formimidoylglutamate deiminase [Alphaproteobacteria bacterium]|nr:formimidoylglutamate deiminase [Alphaproteobacteria bacterium]